MVKYFKKTSGSQRALGLFILMDEHPTNMSEQLATLVGNRGPLVSAVRSFDITPSKIVMSYTAFSVRSSNTRLCVLKCCFLITDPTAEPSILLLFH